MRDVEQERRHRTNQIRRFQRRLSRSRRAFARSSFSALVTRLAKASAAIGSVPSEQQSATAMALVELLRVLKSKMRPSFCEPLFPGCFAGRVSRLVVVWSRSLAVTSLVWSPPLLWSASDGRRNQCFAALDVAVFGKADAQIDKAGFANDQHLFPMREAADSAPTASVPSSLPSSSKRSAPTGVVSREPVHRLRQRRHRRGPPGDFRPAAAFWRSCASTTEETITSAATDRARP